MSFGKQVMLAKITIKKMDKYHLEDVPQLIANLINKVSLLENEVRLLSTSFKTDSSTDDLLNIDEAAQFLNLSKQTVYKKVSNLKIPFSKQGKRLYFSKKDLMQWIQKGNRKTTDDLDAVAELYNQHKMTPKP